MTPWKLPTSLNIGGVDFTIRTDYRHILKILQAFGDPLLIDWMKINVLIVILYEDYESIPVENVMEAFEKGKEFIDYGRNKKSSFKIMDWEQDAQMIVSEINKISNLQDIRITEYMHWWTFLGYYMGIGDGLFSQVVHIRNKKAQGKRLEKWELDFYKKNRDLIDFKPLVSAEEKARREAEQKAVDDLFY